MAIGKISGVMLQSDLTRQGQDLSFDGNLLYLDVVNRRVGVNTTTPNNTVSVNGNVNAQYYFGYVGSPDQPFITNVGTLGNLTISGNLIVGNIDIDGATGNSIVFSGDVITTAGNVRANAGQVSGDTVAANTAVIVTANLGNLHIIDTTISSITANGNIYLTPNGNGIVQITGTNAFAMPIGNTAQQPGYVPLGSLRYNTDVDSPEYWNGDNWITVTTSVDYQTFSGNGTGNTFPLTHNATTGGVLVSLNGVQQSPGVAYTVANTSITFAETPASTDVVDVRYIASGQTSGLNLIGNNVPASSSSTGIAGQVAYNSTYIYICVATNTWIRANIQNSF
jgi:hypothetical protein